MRLNIILPILLGIVVLTQAQPPDTLWTRFYGSDGSDCANSVLQTPDGGFILTGWIFLSDTSDSDLWVIKTNEDGNEEWNRIFGGEDEEEGISIQLTVDGGYIVLGRTQSYGQGERDFWIIKLDRFGNEEWNQLFGGNGNDYAKMIQHTDDGGYVLIGWSNSYGAGGDDIWVIKIDSQGNEEWNQTYGGTSGDYGYSIQQTNDNGYIVTGYTTSFGAGQWDLWLIKTDSQGEVEWDQNYGGTYRDAAVGVIQIPEDGYIVAGVNESINEGNMDWWLVKTDSMGEMEWDQTYGGDNFDICACIDTTLDGGYILGGWTTSFGAGSVDIWIIKTDSMGNEEWNQTFGGLYADGTASVKQTSDSGYIIAGDLSYSSGLYYEDLWLIRLGSESGIVEPQAPAPSEFEIQSVYPNPFNAQTIITINLPETSFLKLTVHNILGREVCQIVEGTYSQGTKQFTYKADDLTSGIYFIRAEVDGTFDQIKKVVLIK